MSASGGKEGGVVGVMKRSGRPLDAPLIAVPGCVPEKMDEDEVSKNQGKQQEARKVPPAVVDVVGSWLASGHSIGSEMMSAWCCRGRLVGLRWPARGGLKANDGPWGAKSRTNWIQHREARLCLARVPPLART